LVPLRNKISFTGEPNYNCYDIIENSLLKVIQFFSSILNYENDKITYEFQITNCNDICLYIHNSSRNYVDLEKISSQLQYFKLNNVIIKNNLVKEIFFEKIIIRNVESFHQNDNNIRHNLYDCILKNCEYVNNMYFIGGEMYLYGKILNEFYINAYFYSDYKSIVEDCYRNNENNHNNENIFLVNYNDFILHDSFGEKHIVINNGKSGLNIHLCTEILRLEFNKIFIISCNKKSFYKDYNILKNKYNIFKQYAFTTNYTINLYIMNRI
jgi:hypothetical protein